MPFKRIALGLLLAFTLLESPRIHPLHAQSAAPPARAADLNHKVYLPLIAKPPAWQRLNSNLPLRWIRDIAINPTPPHEILAALHDQGTEPDPLVGLYRSVDGGQSWTQVNNLDARHVAFAPSNPAIAYATVFNNVLLSVDRGQTWTRILPNTIPGGGWALAIDPTNADHVYIGLNTNATYHVYETLNRGQSWAPKALSLVQNEGIVSLAIDPSNPQTLFAGANTDVAADRQTPYTRLFKSTNGGASWALVQNGFPNSKRVTSIRFNPCNPNQVLVSRQKHGNVDQYLRRSPDKGLTWATIALSDDDIGISPLSPCPIFSDMFSSRDGGLTWQSIAFNFNEIVSDPTAVVYSVWAPDPWNNVLWLGTRDHGMFFMQGIVSNP